MDTDIDIVRRRNLRDLVSAHGTGKQFLSDISFAARAKGVVLVWSPSMLSSMIGTTPTRPVSEKTARRVEKMLDLPHMLMDEPEQHIFLKSIHSKEANPRRHDGDPPVVTKVVAITGRQSPRDSANVLSAAMQAVMGAVSNFNPARHGKLVYLVWENAMKTGSIDHDFMSNLIDLMGEQIE